MVANVRQASERLVLTTLYPLLERLADTHAVPRQAARTSLHRLALATNPPSPSPSPAAGDDGAGVVGGRSDDDADDVATSPAAAAELRPGSSSAAKRPDDPAAVSYDGALAQLLAHNMDYAVDALCARLRRGVVAYPRTPAVVAALLDHSKVGSEVPRRVV